MSPQADGLPDLLSVKQFLRNGGHGVLDSDDHEKLMGGARIHSASQTISTRAVFALHASQDRGKGGTTSLKQWLRHHGNPRGDETVIGPDDTPEAFNFAEIIAGKPNWIPVTDERSRRMAGLLHFSRQTSKDNPARHASLDWLADIVTDPAYSYLLTSSPKTVEGRNGIEYPALHNEWETASMPIQWRPFEGEHVTLVGRHVFDVGHSPVETEIHPIHTIVRQHTSAAPLGEDGAFVPVNRAIVGLGASGGFPVQVGSRWLDETGADPPGWAVDAGVEHNWFTDLSNHRLSFPLFPPVARPGGDAEVRARVRLCEVIEVPDTGGVGAFLDHCRNDDPARGGEQLGFRRWDREAGLPTVAVPQRALAALQPELAERDGSWFDVTIDVGAADGIVVGYYAIVECGWSRQGPHTLRAYDVTFDRLTVHRTADIHRGDWHLYYGVNGQWRDWYTDDSVEAGDSFHHDRTFTVWALDDMPLVIRDCGIEWEGGFDLELTNDSLDRVEITAGGPDHLGALLEQPGVTGTREGPDSVSLRARGWQIAPGSGDKARHEWHMTIHRTQVLDPDGTS